jgi:cell division protein FtsZ
MTAMPKAAVYPESAPEPDPVTEEEIYDHFIPPVAERPVHRQRMPRIEDLPIPAQNQIRASRAEQGGSDPVASDRKRMTLLQRLASVGLGRREDELQALDGEAAPPAAPLPTPVPQHEPVKRAPPAQQQAYRPAQGQLDSHGRAPSPFAPRQNDDDQLEIPAFLRRQAN